MLAMSMLDTPGSALLPLAAAAMRRGVRVVEHQSRLRRRVEEIDRDSGEQQPAFGRQKHPHVMMLVDGVTGPRRRFDAEVPRETRAPAGAHDQTKTASGSAAEAQHAPDELLGRRSDRQFHLGLLRPPAGNAGTLVSITQVLSTGHTAMHCGVSKWPMHSVHFFGLIQNVPFFLRDRHVGTFRLAGRAAGALRSDDFQWHALLLLLKTVLMTVGYASGRDVGALADVGIAARLVHDCAAADPVQVIPEPGER